MKKIILTVAVALFVAAPAQAADCESVRPDLMARAQQMAQNSRDRAIKDFSESSAATGTGISGGLACGILSRLRGCCSRL